MPKKPTTKQRELLGRLMTSKNLVITKAGVEALSRTRRSKGNG